MVPAKRTACFARIVFPVALFFVTFAVAQAETPLPLPTPDLDVRANGYVNAIARQPDGGVIIGGEFTRIDGLARSNLARLKPDGSIDPDWNASTEGPVYALAADATGDVFVGGFFGRAGGQDRYFLAKFAGDGVGNLDPGWMPVADFTVHALAIDDEGSVIAGGLFQSISGLPRNGIAKLSGSGKGKVDPTWDPAPSGGSIETIVFDGKSHYYVGGRFTSIGQQARTRLAMLEKDGAGNADPDWKPQAVGGSVYALVLDGQGALYAGGGFTEVTGLPRSKIVKLSATGKGLVDPAWNPSADLTVVSIALDESGSVYAGGFFNAIGGQDRTRIAKLSATGTGAADPDWIANADNYVNAVGFTLSGQLIAGGAFSEVAGATRHAAARIAVDGSAAAALDAVIPGVVYALAKQPDGSMIVGGRFFAAGDQQRHNVLRLLPDGSLDPAWHPSIGLSGPGNGSGSQVDSLAVDGNDAVYVGGYFDAADGLSRIDLARISGSGVVDPSWNPSVDGEVFALAADGKGALYAGGDFVTVGGLARNHVARLSTAGSGTVDPDWDPSADYDVMVLKLDAAGSVYAGGYFTEVGGQTRPGLARLSPDGVGAADPLWAPNPDNVVNAIEIDADGSIFAGGYFATMGGDAHACVAKLSPTGTGAADPQWNASASSQCAAVFGMALDGRGSLFVGGELSRFGETFVRNVAKLSTSGSGDADPSWNPGVGEGVNYGQGLQTMMMGNDDAVYIGGGFIEVAEQTRYSVAAIPGAFSDAIFADGFDGPP